MIVQLGVQHADCERAVDYFLCLPELPAAIQRPGIGIQRVHVLTARHFGFGQLQRIGGALCVVSVIRDQFTVGVIPRLALGARGSFELTKYLVGFLFEPALRQRFGEIKKVLGMRCD